MAAGWHLKCGLFVRVGFLLLRFVALAVALPFFKLGEVRES
jgi:hypothetical protein